MKIDTFELERNQSLYENSVEINLTESGVEPMTLAELLSPEELDALLNLRLGYNYTEGTPELRAAIASWYPDTGIDEGNFSKEISDRYFGEVNELISALVGYSCEAIDEDKHTVA